TQWATREDFENWRANRKSAHESMGKKPVTESANLLEFEVVVLDGCPSPPPGPRPRPSSVSHPARILGPPRCRAPAEPRLRRDLPTPGESEGNGRSQPTAGPNP